MQEPTEEGEASIPIKNEEEDPNLDGTFAVRRRAAKRTLPWELKAGEPDLVSPPQAGGIPAAKKRRVEEPFSGTTDEATAKLSSPDTAVSLPAAAAAAAAAAIDAAAVDAAAAASSSAAVATAAAAGDHVDADHVKGSWATAQWTPEEDAKLNSAVTKTCKKKYGKKYTMDWAAITALVPGRTRKERMSRWYYSLNQSNDRVKGRSGQWTAVEESKLKDAVQTHCGKNWAAIAALIPGRTQKQCARKWRHLLDANIDRTPGRTGKWSENEDIKLKNAVRAHGGQNWSAIAALIPGRAEKQCHNRWKDVWDPNIDQANGRTGKLTAIEDRKLKGAVQTHGGNDWVAITALVPGRTRKQCMGRWHDSLNKKRAKGRSIQWTAVEESKLKDAVQTHGGKNWAAIAALIPGRTQKHCARKWRHILDANIDRTPGRTGKWSKGEDMKLKDAVRAHGGQNWSAIAAMVPGRVKKQCHNRWKDAFDPNIEGGKGRNGKGTAVEDSKLKDAVQTHGGSDWVAITALAPDRSQKHCAGGTWTEDEDIKLKAAV